MASHIIQPRKRIALVAHDNKKADLLDWALYNRGTLSRHTLLATGTTGALLENELDMPSFSLMCCEAAPEMGLGMGGRMRQQIYKDPWKREDWDQTVYSRCFIHLVNSEAYAGIAGHLPPHKPYKAKHYAEAGLPWFDYYKDRKTLKGSSMLRSLASIRDFKRKSDKSVEIAPSQVVNLSGQTLVAP